MSQEFGGRTFRDLNRIHQEPLHSDSLQYSDYCACPEDPAEIEDASVAELVCSDIKNSEGLAHRPVIDLDFECQLIPSGTPGHHHLYIDKTISKRDMGRLLDVMAEIGLVQIGFRDSFHRRGYSAVRHPDRPKEVKQ